MKKSHLIVLILLWLGVTALTFVLVGLGPSPSAASVDESLRNVLEEENERDVEEARSAVLDAESSRTQVIQDSIASSVSEAESIAASVSEWESKVESKVESVRESFYERSVEESIESSVAASIEESIQESIEESIEESIAESIAESVAEEAARIAQEEAARRAQEEAARRAAEEASRQAEAATQPAPLPPAPAGSGPTVIIGDSRSYGFEYYGLYNAACVFWTVEPISGGASYADGAHGLMPSKAVFLNGIDDLISYGPDGALANYEAFIRRFQGMNPGTQIYVGNVLPVYPAAAGRYPNLAAQVSVYNSMLPGMCARNGWIFFTSSAQGTPGSADGIHFTGGDTAVWLNDIRARVGF